MLGNKTEFHSIQLLLFIIKYMNSSIQFPEYSVISPFHSAQSFINRPASSIKLRRRSKTMIRDHRETPQKKTIKQLEEEIVQNHHNINSVVDHLEEILIEKLEAHQIELLKVFKSTIQKITVEVQDIVQHYKRAIEEVKLSTRIVEIQNQLDFFRAEAIQLFQQNKFYKQQIKKLKANIQQIKFESDLKDSTMKSLAKKMCKLRAFQNKEMHRISLLTQPNTDSKANIQQSRQGRSTLGSKNTRYRSVGLQRTQTAQIKT